MNPKKIVSLILQLFIILFLCSAEEKQSPADPYLLFKQKDFEGASRFFLQQAVIEKDNSIRSSMLYNAASAFHEDYNQNHNQEALEKAIGLYYRALELDKKNSKAAHNLELARKELLKDRNQQSQEDKQKENTSDQKLSQEQNQLAQRKDQNSSAHQEEQEQLQEKSQQALNQTEDPKQKEQLQIVMDKQQEALDAMKQDNPEKAREAQEEAARMLRQYEEGEQGDSPEEDSPSQAGQAEQAQEKPPLDQNLQDILKAEEIRKDQDQNNQDYNIVEKNW